MYPFSEVYLILFAGKSLQRLQRYDERGTKSIKKRGIFIVKDSL